MNLPKTIFENPTYSKKVKNHIEKCVNFLGEKNFENVQIIVVSNKYFTENLISEESKEFLSNGMQVAAIYARKDESYSFNRIYVDYKTIKSGVPKILQHSPVASFRWLKTLAHGLALHLVAEKKLSSPNGNELKFADSFAEEKLLDFKKNYKLWNRINKEIAEWHLFLGLADYKLGRFESAQKFFYLSYLLDSTNEETNKWFYAAKKNIESKQFS